MAERNLFIKIGSFLIGLIIILLAVILSIRFGANDITYSTIWKSIFQYDASDSNHILIHQLRIPRAIAAIFVGAALAVSGAIMQGVTRNALASPSIMGVTAGATFFVAIVFAIFRDPSYSAIVIGALVGAGLGVGLVFLFTSIAKGGITPVKLALAGSAITSLLSALSTAIGLKFDISKDMSYWYAGGLSSIQPIHVQIAVPLISGGIILAILLSRSISVASLGDEVAKGLGLKTTFVRILSTIAVLILTGTAVSIAGMIGFVGLIVPHIVRIIVGVDYRWIIPMSAIFGGALLLVADIVGRVINDPFETPAGAVTALIGVPFFLYLARKDGRGL